MNARSKVSFIILAIITSVSVLLSSCGAAPAAKPTTAPVQPATQAPVATQAPAPTGDTMEKAALSMWGFGGDTDTFTPEIIKRFEAKYPNVTVEYTDIPEDSYTTKLETAMMADAAPDIVTLYKTEWLKAGKFIPVDDVYASANVNIADMNQGALWSCQYAGKTYGVGTYTGGVLLFYNRAMFDAAKLPYPSATVPMTVDEYAALAAKLTQKGAKPEDTVYGGDARAPYWWSDLRTMFSEDGKSMDGVFDSASNVHMYDVLAHMVINGDAPSPDALTVANSSAQDLISQGKMAMGIMDDNELATVAFETNHISYGVAPTPVAEKGDKAWVSSWTDCEGIPTTSKNIQAARNFLAFYLVEGNQLREETGTLPLNMKLANDLKWANSGDTVGRQSELTAISQARASIMVPDFWDVIAPIDGAYADITEGKSDTKTAIAGIMQPMKDALATAWETWDAIK